MTLRETHVAGVPALVLGNDHLEATILVGKGADIYSLRSRHTGIDPLWKSRWGPEHMGAHLSPPDSGSNWLARCPGGWQSLVPSGGAESHVAGALQPQHGEASVVPWRVDSLEAEPDVTVRISCRLTRSPLLVEKVLRLGAGSDELQVSTSLTNEGGVPFPVTWTEHPTLGEPFLSGDCRIHTNASQLETDDAYDVPGLPYPVGTRLTWPTEPIDLAVVPPRGAARQLLAYLIFAEAEAWYSVENPALGTRFAVRWPSAQMPYAWFFQELDAEPGYPWFANTYIMAIEPSSTKPGRGLAYAVEHGVARVLAPGESVTYSLAATCGPL